MLLLEPNIYFSLSFFQSTSTPTPHQGNEGDGQHWLWARRPPWKEKLGGKKAGRFQAGASLGSNLFSVLRAHSSG